MKEFSELEKTIGVTFTNIDLLRQSMVHRSYLNENHNFELDHNERLEFLGDAVLELVVTEYLYGNFPNPEGDLTNWRASLVNSKMLAKMAQKVGLEDFLYLSRGESKDAKSKARQYILANAFEALIGAIHLDAGYKVAEKFIHSTIILELKDILENQLYIDPKSKFQEKAQEEVSITPTYEVLSESGPDHNKTFEVGIFLEEELVAKGSGTSKQEAQEKAATLALKEKGWE